MGGWSKRVMGRESGLRKRTVSLHASNRFEDKDRPGPRANAAFGSG